MIPEVRGLCDFRDCVVLKITPFFGYPPTMFMPCILTCGRIKLVFVSFRGGLLSFRALCLNNSVLGSIIERVT